MQKLADWLEKLGMSRRCRDRRHEQRPQVAGIRMARPSIVNDVRNATRAQSCVPDAAALRQLMRAKIAVL